MNHGRKLRTVLGIMVLGAPVLATQNQVVHSPAPVTHDPGRVILNKRPSPRSGSPRPAQPWCAVPVVVVPGYPDVTPGRWHVVDDRPRVAARPAREPQPVFAATEWNFYQSGRHWAQDLRREVTTWEKFVAYLRQYVMGTAPTLQAEFQRGFCEAYGLNADTAFAKALEQARPAAPPPPSRPKVIVVPPAPATARE